MGTGELLLKAILQQPDDDTARLVYADWLQENGDEIRARFIRDQVWLAANPSCGSCTGPEWAAGKFCSECREREERRGRTAVEMFGRERWIEWAHPAHRCVPAGVLWDDHIQFARGFVSEIRLTLAAFMGHAKAVFSAHPIERVTLTDRRPWSGTFGGYIWDSDQRTGYNPAIYSDVIPQVLYAPNVFTTEADARDWLSTQCVAYGRLLAGLYVLPLPHPTRGPRDDDD